MAFDDILAQIADDEAKSQLRGLVEKIPALKTNYELGEKAKPVVDRLSAMKAENGLPVDFARELEQLPDWVDWRVNRHPQEAQRTTALITERDSLKARLAELEAKGELDMNFDEIKAKLIEEKLVVPPSELENRLTKAEFQNMMMQGFQSQENAYAELTPLAIEHQQKFGKPLNYKEVFQYMRENQRYDPATKTLVMPKPMDAYNAVIAPEVREMEKAQAQAAIDAARKEGVAVGRQEAMQSINGRGMPVSGEGQRAPGGSRFMNRILQRRAENADTTGRLGSGAATQAGVADHYKKLAGTTASL